jgi:hypothetical protein
LSSGPSAKREQAIEEPGGDPEATRIWIHLDWTSLDLEADHVGIRPGGSAGARMFLIALLVCEWTGSAACKAVCARDVESPVASHARDPDEALAGHDACHDQPLPASESGSGRCADPDRSECCGDLSLATARGTDEFPERAAEALTAGPTDTGSAGARSMGTRTPHPPSRLNSPFQRENPPLLS